MEGEVWRPALGLGRAARALVAGEFAQAVGLLRMVERREPGLPAEFEPAWAAARGFLAARAGDWAQSVEWYRRAVEAGPGLPVPGGARCRIGGCGRVVRLRCGQCHRVSCEAHGVVRRDGPARCDDCLWTGLGNLASAAVLLGGGVLAGEAGAVVGRWAAESGSEDARLLKGMLSGDPDAVRELPGGLRALGRVVVLRMLAAELGDGPDGGGARVGALLGALGGAGSLGAELGRVLRRREVRDAVRRGGTAAAYGEWSAAWEDAPGEVTLVHGVGLAALAVAFGPGEGSADNGGDGSTGGAGVGAAEAGWRVAAARVAVGCLAAALYSDGYWDALALVTGRRSVPAEREPVLAGFDQYLRRRLGELDEYLGLPPQRSLAVAWAVELEVLRLLRERVTAGKGAVPAPDAAGCALLGGPLFLTREGGGAAVLRAAGAAGRAAGRVVDGGGALRGGADGAVRRRAAGGRLAMEGLLLRLPVESFRGTEVDRLLELASEGGPYEYLLGQRRFQEVIDAIEADVVVLNGVPDGLPDRVPRVVWWPLLARAYLGRAGERLEASEWQGAFEDFEWAAEYGEVLTRHQRSVEQAARQWGLQLRREDRRSWVRYAEVLLRAQRLVPGSRSVAENLAEARRYLPAGHVLTHRPARPRRQEGSGRQDKNGERLAAAAHPPAEPVSPYAVLGLEPSADGPAVQAAYVGELKAAGRDVERKRRVSAARSALSTPERRWLADLLLPLVGHRALGGPAAEEPQEWVRRMLERESAAVVPLRPGVAELVPLAPADGTGEADRVAMTDQGESR
ncbi:hypothetical protein ACGFX4_32415 [Kitasatospora sp. NPDC048365]|uniref:hypothetical protein n=1 Tax=Kitasatospora sp. NPDC048365 TaxID=3364050 RepID=UPI00371E2641